MVIKEIDGRLDIKSMTLEEITEHILNMGQPKFRAKQIYTWLSRGVDDFSEMTDISKALQCQLNENFFINSAKIKKRLASRIDDTVKYLYALNDGALIESVLMKYHHGYSICVSTQVGCRMGCEFCATGKSGFVRNLTPSEILSQIQTAQKDNSIRISNVVLMGMGEPLDNFDNVIRFLQLVTDEKGMNLSMRHIAVSTCGIVDKIYELAKYDFGLTLSISLHAPNDEIRSQTMPINKRWNIDKLLEACRYYAGSTSRRITFEYAMISGVNDSDKCARELANRLAGMLCHVNLIPVNSIKETDFGASSENRINSFIKILDQKGIAATRRRTLGSDIAASCGQLRGEHTK